MNYNAILLSNFHDHIPRMMKSLGMKRRSDGSSMVKPVVLDPFPDYKKKLSKQDKEVWDREFNAWKLRVPEKSTMRKFSMPLDTLTEVDASAITAYMYEDADKVVSSTKGDRLYTLLDNLSIKCAPQARTFDQLGEKVLRMVGQGTGLMRLKNHDVLLGTLDSEDEVARLTRARRGQQMGHIDVVDVIDGVPECAQAFYSVFLALTPRSEPTFYYDCSVAKLRTGVNSFTTPEAKDAWLLRQLEFAHTLTHEMQAVLNDEAMEKGEWRSCSPGTMYGFDPTKTWHAGAPLLRRSTSPEFMIIYHFGLSPVAEVFGQLLETGVGFGQHAWTPKVADSMMKTADNSVYDLMDAVAPGTLNTLSSILQNQGIPYGILVGGDKRFESTLLTSWVPCMALEERVKWTKKMCVSTTEQWQTGVLAISNPRKQKSSGRDAETEDEGKGVDISELVMYYLKFPGRIFAVRVGSTESKPWHHPSCRSLDRRGKPVGLDGKVFEFRDLMSEGHPGIPSYMQMWEGLARKECCGWMWRHSFSVWSACELSYPQMLRLMTANTGYKCSELFAQVSQGSQSWYDPSTQANMAVVLGDLDLKGSQMLYWGDFYQPRLFTTLWMMPEFNVPRSVFPFHAPRVSAEVLKWTGVSQAVTFLNGSEESKE